MAVKDLIPPPTGRFNNGRGQGHGYGNPHRPPPPPPPPPPPSYTLTAPDPATGFTDEASGNFTVRGADLTDDVVVTPASNLAATFDPASVTLTPTDLAKLFKVVATEAGLHEITTTNDGGLTDPAAVEFDVTEAPAPPPPPPPTPSPGLLLTAPFPPVGLTGAESGSFTVQGTNLTGSAVVTPASNLAGTFTPTTVTVAPGDAVKTFTLNPSAAGDHSVSITNNGGIANPPAVSYDADNPAPPPPPPPPPATYTLTAPPTPSGLTGAASGNFTATGANLVENVTVTPGSDKAATFTPSAVVLSPTVPAQTFVMVPSATGVHAVSTTNNGSLANPPAVNYTASAAPPPPPAPSLTLTAPAPASGLNGIQSGNFIAAGSNLTGSVTVTPASTKAGTFSPSSVIVAPGDASKTFRLTPSELGVHSVSVTNNGGITNPPAVSYTSNAPPPPPPAPSLSLSGPATGTVGQASSSFTVTGANLSGPVNITPQSSDVADTFTPPAVSISPTSLSALFALVAGDAGARSVTLTNNASITNPDAKTYTASAAAPPPPPPPAAPPGSPTIEADSYKIWPNYIIKTGVKSTRYNIGLGLRWQNQNGDWLDANQVSQGATPWYTFTVPVAGAVGVRTDFNVTTLAQRQLAGHNRGMTFKVPTTTNSGAFINISGTFSAFPPELVVTTTTGTFTLIGDLGGLNIGSLSALDTSGVFKLARNSRGFIQFPGLKGVTGTITAASLRLYVISKDDIYPMVFDVMETNPPPIVYAGGGQTPSLGLNDSVGWANLKNDPRVIAAGDFRESNWNSTPGVWTTQVLAKRTRPAGLFNSVSMNQNQYGKTTVYEDPEFPGSYVMRTCISAGNIGGGEMQYFFHEADLTDPFRPLSPASLKKEVYVCVDVFLEDSFYSNNYAFKWSPVGIDCRYGVWSDTNGWGGPSSAYVFGSGQSDSDGKKRFAYVSATGYPTGGQWLYKGHSMRGHTVGWVHPTRTAYPNAVGVGFAPSHLGPYDELWDEGVFGTEQVLRIGDRCIPKGRWVTMEAYIKINTIDLSNPDQFGNGVANNDGIWRMWLDGVLAGERTNLAFHCHPDMGVRGNWLMQYHGGGTDADHDIYMRYRNFVMATEYIGPRTA
jgi:hypothetical protein